MDESRLTIGNYFITPDTPAYPATYLAVTAKAPEIYILNEIKAEPREHAWQIPWNGRVVDCSVDYRLPEQALLRCTWAGKLPDEITVQFNDARHHGRLNKRFWRI